jgi:hypothetical protein
MAQFLKSQSPGELWKAALKPRDLLQPDNGPVGRRQLPKAAKPLGTGSILDVTAWGRLPFT